MNGLIFCDPRFHDLNGVPADRRWRYEHRRDDRLVGVLEGVVTDGVLVSGHSAPFGGPDLARVDPPVEDVVGLVTGALAAMRSDGLREVRVKARPHAYSAAEPLVEYALLDQGFAVAHCDLNMHVDLGVLAPGGDALELLKARKRRYVRAALQEPFELVEVVDGADLTILHGIIAGNRLAKGRPQPLGRDYLERARAAFPERIRMLLLRTDGRAVAGAVVYRVLEGIDQVVHWADDPGAARSPMDLLAYLVYADCLRRGARLVDLGPASDDEGRLNPGLADFKRAVGAVPDTRKVFTAAVS
ncbi:GNAT family N-acetyltransferase [Blastococcus sp. SYSU DS0617]